jgi:glycosyltransferase involved in cell wall biosynthesis
MRRPLRVAFVAPQILSWLGPDGTAAAAGGAERQQALLARELARRGVDVSFVTLDTDGFGEGESHVAPSGADFSFRVHRACRPSDGFPFIRFFHPRLTSLWRALRAADADVYYQRCAGMLTGVVGSFCRTHGRGFVFSSAHESDCDPRTLAIRNPRDRALYFMGLRRASAVIAQTEDQRRLFRERLSIDAIVIRNAAVAKERPAGSSPRRHVLFVAALRPWKRPEWFIELARRMPGTPFVMAGGAEPGRAGYARRVREAAAHVPNLRHLGALSPSEIEALQREALAFVSTSEREGFPNTTLEAWAAGTPVFSATDPDSCIARSGGGAVAPDLDGLARCVAAGLENPDSLALCGERGRAHLALHHGPAASAETLLFVLEGAALRGAGASLGRKTASRAGEGALR